MRAPATRFPPANFSTCAKAHVRLLYTVYIDIYIRKNFSQCQRGERERGRRRGRGGRRARGWAGLDGYFTFEGLVSPWCITGWACRVSAAGPTNRTIRFFPPPLLFLAFYRLAAAWKETGKKEEKKKELDRLDSAGRRWKGRHYPSLSPLFLRHTLHVFRGEFSTILLSPLEPVQIVILANWIEILTIRIVLTKCNTIMPIHTTLRNTFLQKCQLLFSFFPILL